MTGEDPQQGGLARPIGTDQTNDLARSDGKIETLHQHHRAVAKGDVRSDERTRHGAVEET